MTPTRQLPRSRRPRAGAWLAAGVAMTMIVTAGAAGPAGAAPAPVAPAPAAPAGGPAPADATFTLLTGDVVALLTGPDGTRTGQVVVDAGPPGDVVFQQVGDDLYALTGEVVRLIGEGRLDQKLFNLTRLAEYGYDDASRDTLPVITTYGGEPAAARAAARLPAGARPTRTLESVHGQGLAIDKRQAERVWAELTDPAGGAASIWLDAKVEPTLDVSAPAVGAPAAWDAGYDGSDTTIAVLDTGIDLAHPDFDGRIAATRSLVPDTPVQDGHGHGTHVASIAAGSGAAAGGTFRGVAPAADLVIGKVLDDQGSGQVSWVIDGMEWAAAQDVDVVNMSLGGGPDDGRHPLAQAVNRISDESGTLFVISAGNERHTLPGTVTWPGSADRALTVGSVAKSAPHRVSSFSSAGPRADDHAIKPEITAPGAGIVAACAAPCRGGAQYVSNSGTSMAAPHVAGAAAVLAQQHPDWTRGQLRDALVSTAEPNSLDPVTWQGGGMLDLAAATGSPLLATGTLHLGRIEAPHPETVSREVTLRNVSSQRVTAELDLVLRESDQRLIGDAPYQPADGAITISPSSVDIPAGGSAAVTLTVRLEHFNLAAYHGWLQASAGGEVVARTTVGWTKSPQLHRLTIRGIDRAGRPAHTTNSSFLNLLDRDTGEHRLGWWVEGVAHFVGLGPDPRLPEGRYALLANISDWTVQAPFARDTETLISETELRMDQDRTFTFDARESQRVEFRTPRPAGPLDRYLAYSFSRRWVAEVDGREQTLFAESWPTIPGVHVFPTQVEDAGGLGRFETSFGSDYTPENLTMTVAGPDRLALHPEYLREGGQGASCPLPMCNTWFEPGRPYRLADGGTGTPEELAAVDVAGRLVLIREVPHPEFDFPFQYERLIPGIVAAAKEAGAAGVLYGVSDPGPPFRGWNARGLTEPIGIPVAVISHAEADAVAATLAGPGPVLIRTGGEPQAPYIYFLRRTVTGALPADVVFEYAEDEFAAVETHYHSDRAGTILNLLHERLVAPFVRTEYLVGGEQFGLNVIDPDLGATLANPNLWERGTRQYPAGATAVEHVRSRPLAPGFATLTASGSSRLGFSALVRAADDRFFTQHSNLGPTRLRYLHDGQVICERDVIASCSTFGVAGDGQYQIELSAGLANFPAGPTHTTWQVDVEFPDPADPRAEVAPPLVNVDYQVGLSPLNTVRAGLRYPITVTPGYQTGFPEAGGEFTTSAWVSHDDGETWTALGTQSGDQTRFWVRPPRGAEHTSLRVRAEDAEGNSVEQTLIRAWEVTPTGQR